MFDGLGKFAVFRTARSRSYANWIILISSLWFLPTLTIESNGVRLGKCYRWQVPAVPPRQEPPAGCPPLPDTSTLNIDLLAAFAGDVDLQCRCIPGESADFRQHLTGSQKLTLRRFQKILPKPPGLNADAPPA